jgi:hypothetical protein
MLRGIRRFDGSPKRLDYRCSVTRRCGYTALKRCALNRGQWETRGLRNVCRATACDQQICEPRGAQSVLTVYQRGFSQRLDSALGVPDFKGVVRRVRRGSDP